MELRSWKGFTSVSGFISFCSPFTACERRLKSGAGWALTFRASARSSASCSCCCLARCFLPSPLLLVDSWKALGCVSVRALQAGARFGAAAVAEGCGSWRRTGADAARRPPRSFGETGMVGLNTPCAAAAAATVAVLRWLGAGLALKAGSWATGAGGALTLGCADRLSTCRLNSTGSVTARAATLGTPSSPVLSKMRRSRGRALKGCFWISSISAATRSSWVGSFALGRCPRS
mmetsp:Transcript_7196/g.15657  ORF Transcript_7196/g.15657 Transcript_7196/m.15657 type:complete len:233 (+) Transcript_7196:525-1223(+)